MYLENEGLGDKARLDPSNFYKVNLQLGGQLGRPDMGLPGIDKVFHKYHSLLVRRKETVRGISRKRNG